MVGISHSNVLAEAGSFLRSVTAELLCEGVNLLLAVLRVTLSQSVIAFLHSND